MMRGRAPLPPIPDSADYGAKLPADVGMLMNDSLGDCTCAGVLHAIQTWTANAGTIAPVTDANALVLYEAWAGYNPGAPRATDGTNPTDAGADEQTILTDWATEGFYLTAGGPVDRLAAFVELDPRNQGDVRRAIYTGAVVYIGFNVPKSLENTDPAPFSWDVVPGQTQSVGGHCVILNSYTLSDFGLVSWGLKYRMTNAFFSTFCDEAYALVSTDWIAAGGATPLGMSLADLEKQMGALRRAA
jgi:hypothetical protein